MGSIGTCLCGDVGFDVSGAVEPRFHCHCSRCRKAHGAPFVSYVGVPKSGFAWLRGTTGISRYRAAEGRERAFCSHCGSSLPAALEGSEEMLIPAGLLEGDLQLGPLPHRFVGSKAAWFAIPDAAPQFAGHAPGGAREVKTERKTEPRDEAVRGGCLCGAVAYEIIGRLTDGAIIFCHCSRCRHARAAVHNANFFVEAGRLRWLSGIDRVASFKPPDAARFTQSFCTDCGSAVPFVSPQRAVVPAGSLDDDPQIRPGMHIFVGSKARWFTISDALPRYEEGLPAGPSPTK